MRLLLFAAAMVALGLAGWNFNAVLEELRRSLPPQFSELDLRTAVGYHIWTPAASDTARWRYVWSHLWASLFALLMGILLWLWDHLIGSGLFGGLSVLTYAYIAWKYSISRQGRRVETGHYRCRRRWLAAPGKLRGLVAYAVILTYILTDENQARRDRAPWAA